MTGFLSGAVSHYPAEGDAMKYIVLSVLLIVCLQGIAAAEPAKGTDAPASPAALCSTVLMEDDFLPGGAALDACCNRPAAQSLNCAYRTAPTDKPFWA